MSKLPLITFFFTYRRLPKCCKISALPLFATSLPFVQCVPDISVFEFYYVNCCCSVPKLCPNLLQPHEPQSAGSSVGFYTDIFLWDFFPGENTGVVPFPSQNYLPDQGSNSYLLLAGWFFTTEPREAYMSITSLNKTGGKYLLKSFEFFS